MSDMRKLSEEELEKHLAIDTYGDFALTDAVRPSVDLEAAPSEGYRRDSFENPDGTVVPVLMIAVTREKIWDIFMNLMDVTGEMPYVVLETSHSSGGDGTHQDIFTRSIDLAVLKSMLWDYEDLLLNDGCTGIAIMKEDTPM